jgi:hypothetical protein
MQLNELIDKLEGLQDFGNETHQVVFTWQAFEKCTLVEFEVAKISEGDNEIEIRLRRTK